MTDALPALCPLCRHRVDGVSCVRTDAGLSVSVRCPSCGSLVFTPTGLAFAEEVSARERRTLGLRLARYTASRPSAWVVVNGPPETWQVREPPEQPAT